MESSNGFFELTEDGLGFSRNKPTWKLRIKCEVTGRWSTFPVALYYDDLIELRELLKQNTD